MRGLSPTFLDDLQTGWLRPLLARVLADRTLDLQICDNYLNVYYRGGNLLRLTRASDAYNATFDHKYAKGQPIGLPDKRVDTEGTLTDRLSSIPGLKNCMDLYFGRHPKDERDVQQLIARENNIGGVSRSTDFYVCDIEYANPHGRFDLIAVHWPSTSGDRKRGDGRRLVIGEVKQGDNALTGVAGMHAQAFDEFSGRGTSPFGALYRLGPGARNPHPLSPFHEFFEQSAISAVSLVLTRRLRHRVRTAPQSVPDRRRHQATGSGPTPSGSYTDRSSKPDVVPPRRLALQRASVRLHRLLSSSNPASDPPRQGDAE